MDDRSGGARGAVGMMRAILIGGGFSHSHFSSAVPARRWHLGVAYANVSRNFDGMHCKQAISDRPFFRWNTPTRDWARRCGGGRLNLAAVILARLCYRSDDQAVVEVIAPAALRP